MSASSWQAFFEEDINRWWCVGDTWRCTRFEALGIWSVFFFYVVWIGGVTVVHIALQSAHGTSGRNEVRTRRHTDREDHPSSVVGLVLFFIANIAGVIMWIFLGVRWVHPCQSCRVQLFGVALLLLCCLVFLAVHISMSENWSPEPEAKAQHGLVTSGPFRWARHPMYAVFFWAAISSGLATLNWVIALCPFGMFFMVWMRIPTEERILVDLFGNDYIEYRARVPALGMPWGCLDRCLSTADARELRGVLLAGADA